jgi:hypothetical protein
MKTRILNWLAMGTLGLITACTDATPEVTRGPGLPPLQQPRGSIAQRPSMETGILASEAPGECTEWVTELESWDETTGDFEYRQTCALGGAIAVVHTVGNEDPTTHVGNYTTTYELRDGSSVVWTVSYHPNADGSYDHAGSSSDGSSFTATYTYNADGSTSAHEEWSYPGGYFYTVDGTYFADGRFDGTIVYDDLATAANPDFTVVEHDAADGTITQTYLYDAGGLSAEETYVLRTDGSMAITFAYDDPATGVNPDFAGAYDYAASGSGTGGYHQSFDDGGGLDVAHVVEASGAYTESWSYADPDPAVAVDQDGSAAYGADGSGAGSYTNHLADGSSITCSFSVASDGTVTDGGCE